MKNIINYFKAIKYIQNLRLTNEEYEIFVKYLNNKKK